MTADKERRVNPKVLAALGTVVVAVLAFVFVVNPLVLGGDDDLAMPVPASPRTVVESPPPSVDEDVPESLEVFSARDPFRQLVTLEGTPGSGSTPIPPEESSSGSGTGITLALSQVVLDPAGTPRAVIAVDGVEHQPAAGDQFADVLRLVDIAEQCATVQVGDGRVALCAGEEILT